MSTNKLSHLKDGEKIYVEVTRKIKKYYDDDASLFFQSKEDELCVSDEDTFYTLEELKQLANDGMPKQGEIIEVRGKGCTIWNQYKFIAFYEGKIITEYTPGNPVAWDEWQLLQKKTELTLAEVEERLGLDKDSLIIKD